MENRQKGLQIINGGWHFSFLQTPQDIAKKLNHIHAENLILEKILMKKRLRQKIKEGKDIFDRGFNLKKLILTTHFQTIL